MQYQLRRPYIILIIVIFMAISSHASPQYAGYDVQPRIRELLNEVDSLLACSNSLNEAKIERITTKREAFLRASDVEHRYWLASELYEEYSTYDSDSALMYAERALELARLLGRKDLIDDMQLNRAYVLSATGLFDQASLALADIDVNNLSAPMMWKYYESLLSLDSRHSQYIGPTGVLNPGGAAYPAELDSLLQATVASITADNPNYFWFMGWAHLKCEQDAKSVIPVIKASVDSRNFTTRRDAMDAWVLSKLYEYAGDYDNKLYYLLLSAIADLRISNKEIASLEEIAAILFEMGDLDRSHAYITHCIACANSYKSRVRAGNLAQLQELTMSAIHDRNLKQERRSRIYLVALIVILVALVAVLLAMVRKTRQLRSSRSDIESINRELQDRIAELQTTRQQLDDSNAKLSEMYEQTRNSAEELARINESKERYIAAIFGLCSDYIDKLDDFRRNILRMITARKFEEIHALTKNPDLSHVEVKELYANFDRVFLAIYPDFVSDFNSLLRPEERIVLKRPDQLTTELRIYALVRLGLNDSVKIAKFLHVSVQTVYNTRQRTRNKAAVAKESFAETVKGLGKPAL